MDKLSKVLKRIRSYTLNHPELKKSHHFLFNAPLVKNLKHADAIVIGLNPGETQEDWKYDSSLPTEESNEFDFHNEIGESRSSMRWRNECQKYLPNHNIVLSEFFFWSSNNVKEKFSERFGYSFKNSPHFGFCKECNEELIKFHKPKLIIATGTSWARFFAEIYKLKFIRTVKSEKDKRRRNIIHHYNFNGIPFIFTLHWSGAHLSSDEKKEIQSHISRYL